MKEDNFTIIETEIVETIEATTRKKVNSLALINNFEKGDRETTFGHPCLEEYDWGFSNPNHRL